MLISRRKFNGMFIKAIGAAMLSGVACDTRSDDLYDAGQDTHHHDAYDASDRADADASDAAADDEPLPPSIDSFPELEGTVGIEATLEGSVSGSPENVSWVIDYSIPLEVSSIDDATVIGESYSGDVFRGIHAFRFPGFYNIEMLADNHDGYVSREGTGKILDIGTERLAKQLPEIYGIDRIIGGAASAGYADWEDVYYPLLGSLGVSAETIGKLAAYQSVPKAFQTVTFSRLEGREYGLAVFSLLSDGYHGVADGTEIYEALELPLGDVELICNAIG